MLLYIPSASGGRFFFAPDFLYCMKIRPLNPFGKKQECGKLSGFSPISVINLFAIDSMFFPACL